MNKIVELKNISKIYRAGEVDVPALKDITVDINKGTFVSFIGPSGSGKTTLLNLIGALDTPTSGILKVDGAETGRLSTKKRAIFRGENIGFIFQDFNLISVLTVYENVEYPLLMVKETPREERVKIVNALLEKTGMLDQKAKYPSQLSGGQKQRVAVARALTTSPRIVLADEPTANLDHDTAFMVISLMKKMRDESGVTFIFSTHDPKIVGVVDIIHTLEDGIIMKSEEVTHG
ncbi:ABC transporter ATP-binding protein [candidate division WOR-3 bacterium]|nr:ABC transporter ATP-binding protein [candidate division WOR-3 bacterium]